MTKRIKHVSELPQWFNFNKYEFTRSLDSLGWLKQLIPRIPSYAKAQLIRKDVTASLEHESTLQKFIYPSRINPNLFIDAHTVTSLFTAAHYADTDSRSILEHYQIDYNFSDEFLIENFKQCLANARKRHKSIYPKPHRQSDFQHWAKMGILPYIDLFIWSAETDIHITCRVLANALHPYGDKGEETIRKTTIPLVDHVVSQCSMVQLHAQAKTAIVEKFL